jgi:seryl-tRNA synthetase
MIEVREVRANPERMREAIRKRRVDPKKADLDRWLVLDGELRDARQRLESLNAEKNKLAQLGRTDPNAARTRGQELRQQSREIEEGIAALQEEWQRILDWFPNFPHPKMPAGEGEEDNLEECAWVPEQGYLPKEKLDKALGAHGGTAAFMPKHPVHADSQDFTPAHHADIGQRLGGVDTAQGAKVSGSRFAYLFGDVARLQYAIQQLLVGRLLAEGFEPIIPPLLVRERSLYGTSHFPEGRDQVYQIASHNVEEGAELFLVGSSEPSNFSYFMDRTLREDELPIRMFASTPCFRSEAGSWGKDQRGIKRVHQFDKIEMNAICTAAQAEEIYEQLRGVNEWLLQQLEIPYRIVEKCGGDAGYLASHRQRDVEAWLSGLGEFMEVMTVTTTSDYQARRMNIRYKPADGGAPKVAWTLNDTGCALGRIIIAVLDNYQQSDGSVKVPAALRGFVGKDYLRPPA